MSLPVLSADAVRAAEAAFPEQLADGTLMQRAAAAVASECITVLKDLGGVVGRHVLLLVGSGANGGDALFAGVRLAKRGAAVCALPVAGRMHDAGQRAFSAAGGRIIDVNRALEMFDQWDLVIDGMVGLGSTRGLTGIAALMARAIADAELFTVAVDVPSGVHADTGAVDGVAIDADLTVTFGALRRAHVIAPAAINCGEVLVADIGVPMDSADRAVTGQGHWFQAPLPNVDKYTRGVVGIVTGSRRYPGAALLSTAATTRSGCGMVRYYGPAKDDVVAAQPEVVAEGRSGIDRSKRVSAWLVGCGMGLDGKALDALRSVLDMRTPVVVDADAITLIAEHRSLREALMSRRTSGDLTLLTPHLGEAQRLAQGFELKLDFEADRLRAAKRLARACGCLILLKGPTTIITDGSHFLATPLLGAPLAPAGSGDVLAGLIAGAAARWARAGDFSERDFMELAAASALRHSAAAAVTDNTASDLLVGLAPVESATMAP
ncbi:MAG: NAD(P)H-hydrate epimerase [Candidatus Nanopelagicales bacterium]